MNLIYPLGLLGLLGIIALIIIYILKPKYAEKSVSSTFVWKLTLKYKKKKLPFQWLRSSILLIIQLLIITVLSIALSQPIITLASKSGEKIIILEASASMLTEENGRTRFDRALTDIAHLVDITTPKDKVSVILAAEEATPLVIRSDSAGFIKQSLSGVSCTFGEADIDKAIKTAEGILKENTAAEIILYSGREHPNSGITVVNKAASEWNAAILDFKAEFKDGKYKFIATVASYNKALPSLSVGLKVDGNNDAFQSVALEAGKAKTIEFNLNTLSYGSARLYIEAADAFIYDNEFFLFGGDKQNFRVQLISKAPLFLGAALRAVKNCDVIVPSFTPEAAELIKAAGSEKERLELVDSFTIDDYMVEYSGYDLYVFERMTPDELPVDGAVWLVNPDKAPSNSGLRFGARVSGSFALSANDSAGEPNDTILANISTAFATVSEYRRVLESENYYEILTIGDNPVLLSRHEDGVKITAIAFDFHNSNLPISLEFPLLINNLCKYSLARTTDKFIYDVGTKIQLNASAAATAMIVEGTEVKQDFDTFPANITVKRNGVYTVSQMLPTRTVEDKFFVRIAEHESNFSIVGEAILKPVVTGKAPDTVNDYMDIFLYIGLALIIFLSIEWGLQYREQY